MRKMKDSGIEWIGKIPDIWRQTKLKYVTKIRSENGMYSPEQDSYIGLENIVSRSYKLIETETIYESALYSICKKGDILFNKLRPYLAKAIISPIDGFCTGELLNIKHFDGEKRFLWYYLLSDKFIEVVNASTYGAKMPRANTDFILNLPVFLPPLAEQQRIADFLDEKCGEIDSIRSDIQKQIDILNDYKKSVIT
jgi:restriction endonuclease S subunit